MKALNNSFKALAAFALLAGGVFAVGNTAGATVMTPKAITSFGFNAPAVSGVINNSSSPRTISVTVPAGTDVTSLAPVFDINGSQLWANGVRLYNAESNIDFTEPVTFVVDQQYTLVRAKTGLKIADAEVCYVGDNCTVSYVVTVSVASSVRRAKKADLMPADVTDTSLTVSYNQEGTLTQHLGDNITAKLFVPAGGALDEKNTGGGAIFKIGGGAEADAFNGRFIEITATDCFGNSVHEFSKSLTITVSGLKLPADVSALTISYFDTASKKWVEVTGAKFDAATGSVVFTVDHLTKFAVMAKVAPVEVVETEQVAPATELPKAVLGVQKYADGTLIRGTDMKIYVIVDGHKVHVRSLAELFAKYRGQEIINVADEVLALY